MPLCDLEEVGDCPQRLWRAQDSFERAVDDKLSTYLIETTGGKSNKVEVFESAMQGKADHPKMVKMPWKKTVEAVRARATKLTEFKKEVAEWELGVSIKEQRANLDEMFARFDESLKDLAKYQDSVDDLCYDSKYAEQIAKDQKKGVRDRMYGMLWKQGLPKGVSKVGSCVHCLFIVLT